MGTELEQGRPTTAKTKESKRETTISGPDPLVDSVYAYATSYVRPVVM